MKAEKSTVSERKVLTYDQIADARSGYITALKTLNTCRLLSREKRREIRTVIDTLQDAVHGVRAKLIQLNEDYQELKAHKSVVEDKEAFRKILVEMNLDLMDVKAALGEFRYSGELVSVSEILEIGKLDPKETIQEKNSFYPFFTEMEDIFLS